MENKIFKCYNTILELLKDRGFEIPMVYSNITLSNFKYLFNSQSDKLDINLTNQYSSIYVKFLFTDNSIKNIIDLSNVLKKNGYDQLIIIVCDESLTEAKINELHNTYIKNCSIFYYKYICINIANHYFVPKHEKISDSEKSELIKNLNITDNNFPILNITDPIAKYYGFQLNDIIKIYRNVQNSSFVTYRIIKYLDSGDKNNLTIDDDTILDYTNTDIETFDSDTNDSKASEELEKDRKKYLQEQKEKKKRKQDEIRKSKDEIRKELEKERLISLQDLRNFNEDFIGKLGTANIIIYNTIEYKIVPSFYPQYLNFEGKENNLLDYYNINSSMSNKLLGNIIYNKDFMLNSCSLSIIDLKDLDKKYSKLYNNKFILFEDEPDCNELDNLIMEKININIDIKSVIKQNKIFKYLNEQFNTIQNSIDNKKDKICILNNTSLLDYNIFSSKSREPENSPSFLIFNLIRLNFINFPQISLDNRIVNLPEVITIKNSKSEDISYNLLSLSYFVELSKNSGHYKNIIKLSDNNYYTVSDNSSIINNGRLSNEQLNKLCNNSWSLVSYIRSDVNLPDKLMGINNPSAFCFANSAIQILFSIETIKINVLRYNHDEYQKILNSLSVDDLKKDIHLFTIVQKKEIDKKKLIDIINKSKDIEILNELNNIFNIMNESNIIQGKEMVRESITENKSFIKSRRKLVEKCLSSDSHVINGELTDTLTEQADNTEFFGNILNRLYNLNIIDDVVYESGCNIVPTID